MLRQCRPEACRTVEPTRQRAVGGCIVRLRCLLGVTDGAAQDQCCCACYQRSMRAHVGCLAFKLATKPARSVANGAALQRSRGRASVQTRLRTPAAPLSDRVSSRTGGFASPPCDGFALVIDHVARRRRVEVPSAVTDVICERARRIRAPARHNSPRDGEDTGHKKDLCARVTCGSSQMRLALHVARASELQPHARAQGIHAAVVGEQPAVCGSVMQARRKCPARAVDRASTPSSSRRASAHSSS